MLTLDVADIRFDGAALAAIHNTTDGWAADDKHGRDHSTHLPTGSELEVVEVESLDNPEQEQAELSAPTEDQHRDKPLVLDLSRCIPRSPGRGTQHPTSLRAPPAPRPC